MNGLIKSIPFSLLAHPSTSYRQNLRYPPLYFISYLRQSKRRLSSCLHRKKKRKVSDYDRRIVPRNALMKIAILRSPEFRRRTPSNFRILCFRFPGPYGFRRGTEVFTVGVRSSIKSFLYTSDIRGFRIGSPFFFRKIG